MRGARPILLLTNNSNVKPFTVWLRKVEEVVVFSEPLTLELMESVHPAFTLSFNYRHIVKPDVIERAQGRIANVHCSVLPYNRGTSPNFFSYYENTPKGVTVHEMSADLDKGAILLQRVLDLGEDETFSSSYGKLIEEAMALLRDGWTDLRNGLCVPRPQGGEGSYHTSADLESVRRRYPFELDDRVSDWKGRYELV